MKSRHLNCLVALIVCSLLSYERLSGQDTLSNLRIVFVPETPIGYIENDTVDNPLMLADTLIYKVGFDIDSTEDISKIHVKMGTSVTSGDLFNTYFVPGASVSPPLAYSEAANHVTLTTGLFDFYPEVYLEVWLEYDDNSTSQVWLINTVD